MCSYFSGVVLTEHSLLVYNHQAHNTNLVSRLCRIVSHMCRHWSRLNELVKPEGDTD